MEKTPKQGSNASLLPSTGIGSRFSNLNKSFKYSLRSLLTSCSKEVITSLHENLEDGFETVCLQTQAGATLDAVEEIVEEQDLDVLFSDRSNIMDVAENLSMAKKNEIQHLKHMVQLGEEHNQMLHTRLQLLREGNQVLSGATQAVEKQHEVRSFTTRTEQPPKLEIDPPMSSPVQSRKTAPQADLLPLSVTAPSN